MFLDDTAPMKSSGFLIHLFILFLAISCQVKETSTTGLISGHISTTNAFTIITPSARTFVTAETLSISLSFPFEVSVTGIPQVELTIGTNTRYANYFSGDGTKILTFKYIVSDDTDSDGISVDGIQLNGGDLTFDNAGVVTNCSLTLTAKEFSNVKVTNTNAFTILTPTSKIYTSSDTLSIDLTFPFTISVSGLPQLNLDIGGSTVNADYSSGNGTTTLTFQYVIQPTDNDSNGISLTGLSLNGGSLTFDNNGVSTNCNTTIATPSWATVLVDNSSPTITAFTLTNPAGFYHKDLTLTFTVTYSEAVIVSGTPKFILDFATGAAVYADYVSGSGTNIITFTYVIDNAVSDTNGYDVIGPTINLNGGSIQDAGGNNSDLDLSAHIAAVTSYSAIVNIDGRIPYIVSITPPSDDTYLAAESLSFTVNFDRAVNVTGSPYIGLTIGSNIQQAAYASGSGTSALVFNYVLVPGDVDSNGVSLASTITSNGATITGTAAPTRSYFLTANNTFTTPVTTSVLVNAIQPQPISVIRTADTTLPTWGTSVADNVWNIGQTLHITIGFNVAVYVNQIGGVPRIPLTIGASTQYATYLSGGNGQTSLIFQYIIQSGDLDNDASITIENIDLNGGTIMDVNGTNSLLTLPIAALASTTIDGVRPSISAIDKPVDGTYSTVTGNNHLNMNFVVTWSEDVIYSGAVNIPLTIGATSVNAVYSSGNTTSLITHRVASLAGYTDTDGIVAASPMTSTTVIKDRAGNTNADLTYSPPTMTSVKVDTTTPTIITVTSPASGSYTEGNNLDFIVNFSEVVNVTESNGYPHITLAMDSGTKYATYYSGSGTNSITFRYIVAATDLDNNGIANPTSISISNAPTAYIRDLAWNGGTSTSYVLTSNLTDIVVDGLYPTVSSRSAPADGTYDDGDIISFTINYSEAVTVTGTPRIQVGAQTGTLNFNYASGSGTTDLTFSYLVTSNDFDLDGLSSSITTIDLNSGTIKDSNNNNADITFAALNLSSVYLAYPNMTVWSTSSFTNQSAISGITVSSSGAVTTTACGSGTCREFNGDDQLNLSGAVNGVETAFFVFKNPAALSNMDMIGTDIGLIDDGSAFDLNTESATLDLDGMAYSGTIHDTNMTTSSTHIIQIDYTLSQDYPVGTLIDTPFRGAIGEVILVTGALSTSQKDQILIYLNDKY